MKPVKVNHVEVCATDLERAKKFYSAVFGWTDIIMQWDPNYLLIDNSKEDPNWVSFGIYKVEKNEAENKVMATMEVDDIDATLKLANDNGGSTTREKYEISPEIGHAANFKDSEGNIWGLHSAASS